MSEVKWVLVKKGEKRVAQMRDVVTDGETFVLLTKSGSTGTVIPKEDVFDSQPKAHEALALGGQLSWVFDMAVKVRHSGRQTSAYGEVYKARIANTRWRNVIQRVDDNGKPVGKPVERWSIETFPTKRAALKAMARRVALRIKDYQASKKALDVEAKVIAEEKAFLRANKTKLPKVEDGQPRRRRPSKAKA